jgi:hypothetical protein
MRSCGNHILSWGFLLKKNSQNSTIFFWGIPRCDGEVVMHTVSIAANKPETVCPGKARKSDYVNISISISSI